MLLNGFFFIIVIIGTMKIKLTEIHKIRTKGQSWFTNPQNVLKKMAAN